MEACCCWFVLESTFSWWSKIADLFPNSGKNLKTWLPAVSQFTFKGFKERIQYLFPLISTTVLASPSHNFMVGKTLSQHMELRETSSCLLRSKVVNVNAAASRNPRWCKCYHNHLSKRETAASKTREKDRNTKSNAVVGGGKAFLMDCGNS